MGMLFFIGFAILCCARVSSGSGNLARPPTRSECDGFASAGACVGEYEEFMKEHCRPSCDNHHRQQRLALLDPKMNATSFFELSANDIEGNLVDFEVFRGKVSLLTNVASECGFTEQHYDEMNELYAEYSDTGRFEIVAFPCNQFDGQEPGGRVEIQELVEEFNVQFRMMDKVMVNGPATHSVYKFLKKQAGPEEIEWNFGSYYIVSPTGLIRSFHGVSPLELREILLEALA